MSDREWDVGLSRVTRQGGAIQMTIPSAVARALVANGYDRAILTISDDGMLFKPYVSNGRRGPRQKETVELPAWGKK